MSRPRILGWTLVALLAFVSVRFPGPAVDRPGGGLVSRLIGPVAGLAASVQWVRVGSALQAGRPALAFARAEFALDLDPGATHGWELLASYQGFTLASRAHEPDPARRLLWLEAGLATALRGEATARRPAVLALTRGSMLLVHAEQDPELPWPGGEASMLEAAAKCFEQAAALGHPDAPDLARYCRELR